MFVGEMNTNLKTKLYKTKPKHDSMEEFEMKKNYQNKTNKNSKKRIVTSLLLVALALLMVAGVFMLSPMKASAATNRAGVYTISGTYDIGDGSTSGYLDDFRITIATQYFRDDSATVLLTLPSLRAFFTAELRLFLRATPPMQAMLSSFRATISGLQISM